VGVDPAQTTIPVDIASAATAIGNAISQALADASVDVNVNQAGGQAVGADSANEFQETVQRFDDRILEVNDTLGTKIETVRGEAFSIVSTEVASQVNAALTRIQQDINEHRNNISAFNSQIRSLEHQTTHQLREVDRKATDAQNLASRPPGPVTLI